MAPMWAFLLYGMFGGNYRQHEAALKYLDESLSNFSNRVVGFDHEIHTPLVGLKNRLLSSKAKSDIEVYRELKEYAAEVGIEPAGRFYDSIIKTYERNEEPPTKACRRGVLKKILGLRLVPLAVWHALFATKAISPLTYFGLGSWLVWLPMMVPTYEEIKQRRKAAKMAQGRNDYIFAPRHVLEASCIPQMVSEAWEPYPGRTTHDLTKYLLPDKLMRKFRDAIANPYQVKLRKRE
jgi:hypothetical protein